MSKIVKGIKKVFKKIGKFVKRAVKWVKKNWKVIALAVAVYFTAGVALSAFPSTASFASALPGFGATGANALFSKAAVSLGFKGAAGSGIAAISGANAAAAGVGAIGAGVSSGSVAGGAGASAGLGEVAVTGAKIASAATPSTAGMAAMGATVPGSTAAMMTGSAAAATGSTATGIFSGMSTFEKVRTIGMGLQFAGNLMKPSASEEYEDVHNLKYGNAMGIGRDGQGPGTSGVMSSFNDYGALGRDSYKVDSFADVGMGREGHFLETPDQYTDAAQRTSGFTDMATPLAAAGKSQSKYAMSDFISNDYSGSA